MADHMLTALTTKENKQTVWGSLGRLLQEAVSTPAHWPSLDPRFVMCLFTCRVKPSIHCLITAILPPEWYSSHPSCFTQEDSEAEELEGWSEISDVGLCRHLSGDPWIFTLVFTAFTLPFLRGCNDVSPLFLSENICSGVIFDVKSRIQQWLRSLTFKELVSISVLQMVGWGLRLLLTLF